MAIHDDADMATIVSTTVSAIKEGALHIGKADRHITPAQIEEVRAAIAVLVKTLGFKEKVNANRT
jgi:hypothetical protein